MKIIVVTVALGHGGAERVGVSLANGFSEHGHEVLVLTDLTEPVVYHVNENIKIVDFVKGEKSSFKKWCSAVSTIRKVVKREHPDVILGIMGLCTMVSWIGAIGLGVPVVMTDHFSFERPIGYSFTRKEWFFKFIANKLYKYVTVLTEADKKVIGNSLKNVVVMPNPLIMEPVCTLPRKEQYILAAGRLDGWKSKGFDLLIKAWGILMKDEEFRMKNPGWRLQIAGTGSEKSLSFLKQLCKDSGVENSVDFLGFQTDMEKIYKHSEIFVLSSRYEGFGLVLIEAMSQGCACVACDFKGRQREIITDDSFGICCETENVEALANSIYKMMADDEYRKMVQKNAIERSKFYSLDNTIERWELFLKETVKV